MTLIAILRLSPRGFELCPSRLQCQTLTTELTRHGLSKLFFTQMKYSVNCLLKKEMLTLSWQKWKIAGIAPDSKHVTEQSEALEHERKTVRESLILAYDKNIATRLKAEVSSMEVINFNNITKDACTSKCSCSIFIGKKIQKENITLLVTTYLFQLLLYFLNKLMQGIK